ncbi:tetratricopeptide repeat protein [Aureimonas sp. AU4]|uniref:tetratricopeptide repeat protein n=1 Tax=Aureimonas sp. AU4 TaxID=1638163 RepID=UPI0007843123|nr:tetratricopeptide repeat protein [Aureimonas sp. AU4]
MTNDTFIREVNEEVRRERMERLGRRYGAIAIAVAVAIVLGVGAYVLWERYREGLEAADGTRFVEAGALIDGGKPDEARPILEALASNGVAAYPTLARLRLADLAQAGDPAAAVPLFDAVANDGSAPQNLRDAAAVRAAYILVDTGTLQDVRARVERLTVESEPMRYVAREAVALSAFKAGDVETARPLFQQLAEDLGTPRGIKQRAGLMVETIAASTPAAAPAASAPAPASAPVEGGAAPASSTPAAPAGQPPA